MSLYVEPLIGSLPSAFQYEAPFPEFAGLIQVPGEATNVADPVIFTSLLPASRVAQTMEHAVENYSTLLRKLAD